MHKLPRLCSVGYTGVFYPGIILQRTSVSCVGYSYPYLELLEVLYARCHNTRGTDTACFEPARNFCEFYAFFWLAALRHRSVSSRTLVRGAS